MSSNTVSSMCNIFRITFVILSSTSQHAFVRQKPTIRLHACMLFSLPDSGRVLQLTQRQRNEVNEQKIKRVKLSQFAHTRFLLPLKFIRVSAVQRGNKRFTRHSRHLSIAYTYEWCTAYSFSTI